MPQRTDLAWLPLPLPLPYPDPLPRRLHGVVEQHRDRHRSDAPGDRCNRPGDLLHLVELHVAHQPVALLQRRIVDAVHATSMTTASGFTMSPVTNSGLPIATMR